MTPDAAGLVLLILAAAAAVALLVELYRATRRAAILLSALERCQEARLAEAREHAAFLAALRKKEAAK